MATLAPARPAGAAAPADDDAELFDVVDASNAATGTAPRGVVHRDGLLHRAAHVLVFRAGAGGRAELLLQRRSPRKRVAPGRLDLSCAEHVAAGEGFLAAAARGLGEELGLRVAPERLWEVRAPLLRRMVYESVGVVHNEFVALYAVAWRDGDGEARGDEAEVEECFWVEVEKLREMVPTAGFTPWFLQEMQVTNLEAVAEKACQRG